MTKFHFYLHSNGNNSGPYSKHYNKSDDSKNTKRWKGGWREFVYIAGSP